MKIGDKVLIDPYKVPETYCETEGMESYLGKMGEITDVDEKYNDLFEVDHAFWWKEEHLTKLPNLKLSIDSESVSIYIDNEDNEEPIYVCYWHKDEWIEDPDVVISIARAIELFYLAKELLKLIV